MKLRILPPRHEDTKKKREGRGGIWLGIRLGAVLGVLLLGFFALRVRAQLSTSASSSAAPPTDPVQTEIDQLAGDLLLPDSDPRFGRAMDQLKRKVATLDPLQRRIASSAVETAFRRGDSGTTALTLDRMEKIGELLRPLMDTSPQDAAALVAASQPMIEQLAQDLLKPYGSPAYLKAVQATRQMPFSPDPSQKEECKQAIMQALVIASDPTNGVSDRKRAELLGFLRHCKCADVKTLYLMEIEAPTGPACALEAAGSLSGQELTVDDLEHLIQRIPALDAEVAGMVRNRANANPDLTMEPIRPCTGLNGEQIRRPDLFHKACETLRADPLASGLEDTLSAVETEFENPDLFSEIILTINNTRDADFKARFNQLPSEAIRIRNDLDKGKGDVKTLALAMIDASDQPNGGLAVAARRVIANLTPEQLERILRRLADIQPPGLAQLLDRLRAAIFGVIDAEQTAIHQQRLAQEREREFALDIKYFPVGGTLLKTVARDGGPSFAGDIDQFLTQYPQYASFRAAP